MVPMEAFPPSILTEPRFFVVDIRGWRELLHVPSLSAANITMSSWVQAGRFVCTHATHYFPQALLLYGLTHAVWHAPSFQTEQTLKQHTAGISSSPLTCWAIQHYSRFLHFLLHEENYLRLALSCFFYLPDCKLEALLALLEKTDAESRLGSSAPPRLLWSDDTLLLTQTILGFLPSCPAALRRRTTRVPAPTLTGSWGSGCIYSLDTSFTPEPGAFYWQDVLLYFASILTVMHCQADWPRIFQGSCAGLNWSHHYCDTSCLRRLSDMSCVLMVSELLRKRDVVFSFTFGKASLRLLQFDFLLSDTQNRLLTWRFLTIIQVPRLLPDSFVSFYQGLIF